MTLPIRSDFSLPENYGEVTVREGEVQAQNSFCQFKSKLAITHIAIAIKWKERERSGSVVECLTRDQEAVGSSFTDVTVLWSLSKTHLSYLSTGSTEEDPSLFN